MSRKNKFSLLVGLILACVLMAGEAYAGTPAASTKTAKGYSYVICDAEVTASVPCQSTVAGEEDYYVNVSKFDRLTFYLIETGGAGSSCDIYATGLIHDVPGTADLSTLSAIKISSTPLTLAQDKLIYTDFGYHYVWIICTAVGGTDTTVYMDGSYGRQRTSD